MFRTRLNDFKIMAKNKQSRRSDEPGDKLPPHSLEAEQFVLGCALLQPGECVGDLLEAIKKPEFFYDPRHQLIFKIIQELNDAGRGIDSLVVFQTARDGKMQEQIGGAAYLSGLQDVVTSVEMLAEHLVTVTNKYLLRELQRQLQFGLELIADGGEEKPRETVARIEQSVMAVSELHIPSKEQRFGEVIPAVMDKMEGFTRSKRMMEGLATGFNYLDNMMCGLKSAEMIVIAARPSVGKTSIVMQIAEHVAAELREPVGFFTMEMTSLSLVQRQLFSTARADFQKFRNGFLLNEDVVKLTHSAAKWSKAPLYLDDASTLTPRELKIKMKRMIRKYGIKLFCIDYLQLMNADQPTDNRAVEIGRISQAIKQAAKDLNVPVCVLAQMNRSIEQDPNRKPQLSDLRESGQIEQDADVVGFLYDVNLKKYENELDCPQMRWLNRLQVPEDKKGLNWKKYLRRLNLLVAKQRNGPTGDVALVYLKEYMRFVDAYTPPQEEEQLQGKISDEDVPD